MCTAQHCIVNGQKVIRVYDEHDVVHATKRYKLYYILVAETR